MVMSKSEAKAFEWLKKNKGYAKEQIICQSHRSPDFIITNGEKYEVKKIYSNKIIFYKKQIEKLTDDTFVLVFDDINFNPCFIFKWKDIKNKNEYNGISIIKVMLDTTTVQIDKETWDNLALLKIKNGFECIGDSIKFCVNKITGKNKENKEVRNYGMEKDKECKHKDN